MTNESPILALDRPHPVLFTYYVLTSLLSGPALLFTLPYLYFRYHTLRYRFDQEGIHMRVGLLFRREVNLTYARIQDIHLRSNLIQRWLGLANVEIQTASGSTGAELVIEGFKEFEAIRDFLYSRMRGVVAPSGGRSTIAASPADLPEAVSVLFAIRDELKRTREILEGGRQEHSPGTSQPHG